MSRANLQALEKKISEEEEKLKQAKARLQQLERRKTQISRSERTRRLIIIGAVILTKAEKEEDFKASLMQWLDEGITAERDRAAFDLPLTKKSNDKEENHAN